MPLAAGVYRKDPIVKTFALQAFTEMIRKASGKSYRSQKVEFRVGEVPV